MLSGIKRGKRKRPATVATTADVPSQSQQSSSIVARNTGQKSSTIANNIAGDSDNNRSAADALRMNLLGGGGGSLAAAVVTKSSQNSNNNDIQSKLDARLSAYNSNESTIQNLQSRGRISTISHKQQDDDDDIVIHHQSSKASKTNIEYENEHKIRYNSRGKLSRHAHEELRSKTESEMTIEEMAKQERDNTGTSNMDEVYARNMIKMGKSYNKLDKIMGTNSKSGADEEDYGQESNLLANLYKSNDDKLSPAELAARSKSKQIAQHDAIGKWTSKSWWWMESSNFNKQYLIALGEKVSLVMTPSNKRLRQYPKKNEWVGGQCYIVPLSYNESFVGLDEEVWVEIRRFQSCLRQMFAKEGRGVIFIETVMRASKGGSGGGGMALQAKMECIPVPTSVERDAPLYFKSALAEVAQEWGTHQKTITLDGQKKTLRNAVPKGFPYFYCGWGEGGNEGFVQLIENEDDGDDYGDHDNNAGGYGAGGGMRSGGGSKHFSYDFGLDTIGGMMGCDPMRFQRKMRAVDGGDRAVILQFCDKWKPFDWTLELDG